MMSQTGVIDRMFKAGAHFGYSRARRHPSTKQFIFGAKNRVEILNLEKTSIALLKAKQFARELGATGKQILFVGTKPEARVHMTEAALSAGMPYVSERWIGGLLTNFHEIKKRVARLEDLTAKREAGELSMYTKKERLLIDREIKNLEKNFGGVTSLSELPKALFVVDSRHEKTAVSEAKRMKIPVIALAGTDCNISALAYPVPGNDSAAQSITFFVREIAEALREGKTEVKPTESVAPAI